MRSDITRRDLEGFPPTLVRANPLALCFSAKSLSQIDSLCSGFALDQRVGPLANGVHDRVVTAGPDDVEVWLKRVIGAKPLHNTKSAQSPLGFRATRRGARSSTLYQIRL